MLAPVGGPLLDVAAKTLVGVHSGLRFAKSPQWIRQKLLFLDVHDRCIKSADLQGNVRTVTKLPYLPGGFGALADGDLVVGDAWQRKLYRWNTTGLRQMADLSDLAGFCLSDGVVDRCGGIYVADAGFDFLDPLMDPVSNGVIVHIAANGNVAVVAGDLFFPSGMVITPDNRTMIVAETLAHRLIAFDIVNDGSLQNRRVWAQFQDDVNPDGICLDCTGAIWVAGTSLRVLLVREGGDVVQQIKTRRPVFATMLGGPERRHLFMCTSNSNDPIVTRRVSGATIDVSEVEMPGCGAP